VCGHCAFCALGIAAHVAGPAAPGIRLTMTYDDERNIIPPLASVAEEVASEAVVDKDKSMFIFYFNCA
jgi:hypothetical protein